MTLEQLIQEFDTTASACREILQKEIRLHSLEGNSGDENLLGEKEKLIRKLEALVKELRVKSEGIEESPYNLRDDLNQVQQKLMQVMRMDRELEKLLLSSQASARSKRSRLPSSDVTMGKSSNAGLAARRYKAGESPDI